MNLQLALSGVLGFLGVAFGAFGAHAIGPRLEGTEDAIKRLGWWETATLYLLIHALALGIAALLSQSEKYGALVTASGWCFFAGALVFSGTLFAMTLGAPRFLGAITPLGGLTMLAGWALLAAAGFRS